VEFAGKKVLMLVENNSVPFDKRVWREANTLSANGFLVTIVCPIGREHKKKFELRDNIKIYRYDAYFSKGSSVGYVFEYFQSLVKMFFISIRIFLDEGFQIIHTANPPDTLWIICMFYRLFGVKFIFDEHDLTPEAYLSRFRFDESKKKSKMYKLLSFFQFISYKLSNAVISTNISYKKIAITRGAEPDKVFIVRNGPDTRDFHYVKPVPKWKSNFSFLAAYIGVMAVQDGVDNILKACKYIVYELNRKDIYFILIGKGDEFENLRKMAKNFKIEKFVHFTGRIPDEDVMEILSTADVCLAPDPSNPLNDYSTMNKIMEYMICKSPIVSFDLVESRYSAQDAAIYVQNNNIEEFAKGIVYLLSNKNLSNTMANFGYNRVINKLSWENQEINLIKAYKYPLQ